MKCPKCGYVSHDYLNACRKCSVDLLGFKAQMQLHVVQTGNIDLRSVLGGMQPSPIASGEFDMGEALFDSPMLVDAQAEDGFDISLDDDFSFTPSAMSLESLDGFEISNIDSMNLERPRPASTDSPGTASADTSYETVMMDISDVNDEGPPFEVVGDMFDAPIELAEPELDAPIESAEPMFRLPDLPADDAIIEPDLTSAVLRSSVGRTSDLDLTSMELRRTTRDIEILNQLKNEALSGDTVLPEPDEPEAIEAIPWSSSDIREPSFDGFEPSGSAAMGMTKTDQPVTSPDDAALPFAPTLPESFPEEAEGTDELNDESGELILPSFATDFPSIDATAQDISSTGSASGDPEASFIMPDLPSLGADEESAPAFTEEFSLDIDPNAPPEPLPVAFPSLQTTILPTSAAEEGILADHASTPEPVPPAIQEDEIGSHDTRLITTALELGDLTSSQPDDASLTATPQEARLADETPPPLPVEPVAEPIAEPHPAGSSHTGYATIEMDIDNTQPPETPDEAPVFPDLPDQTDAFLTPLSNEVTIVDEPSPLASADHPPVDPASTSADTGYATIKLDIGDIQPPEPPRDEPLFPDLPDYTDAILLSSHDEATIVDEFSPFASGGHTPINFAITPPNTGGPTIKLDIGDMQLPKPPEVVEADVDEGGDDLDLELLFPDEQSPNERD